MIDPLDSLAFSMQKAKGVYALLLGSGVSRTAGIPTGWHITLDLVTKVATLRGEDPGQNPERWFRDTFKSPPSYSRLLDEMGKTGPERRTVIRDYIVPSPAEREDGLKLPTKAHHAIASLVAGGYVRVILTTNFDKLTEDALAAAGVDYQVVTSADGIKGMDRLPHASCTVVKLHGDYTDTRIKNTVEELAEYDPEMNSLLDRVLDEYGLVVCGWSAEWDTALCEAIKRCPNRRYSTYWTSCGHLSEPAGELIRHRKAAVVPNVTADGFFEKLVEKVKSLEDLNRSYPLSTAVAVATLKRYVADPTQRVRLFELISGEADRVVRTVAETHKLTKTTLTFAEMAERAQRLEVIAETASALFAHGCYFSDDARLWSRKIEHLAKVGERWPNPHCGEWEALRFYPSLLCLYAGGMGAIAANRYATLVSLLSDVRVRVNETDKAGLDVLDAHKVMCKRVGACFPGRKENYTPASERIHEVLRSVLAGLVPNDWQYDDLFDRFEYLRTLAAEDNGFFHTPARFWYQYRQKRDGNAVEQVDREIEKQGDRWEVLRCGLFLSDAARFQDARSKVLKRVVESDVGW